MNAQLKMDNGLSPLRVGRITGSRVGAILGLNPYSKRADVLREMVREWAGAEREFTGNAATDYGKEKEPDALAAYEAERGVMTYGGDDCLVHPAYDFLAVTPDGLVGDDGMIECKAPYSGTYTHWNQKPYYEAQMRLQLECAGREWCDFAVLDRDGNLHISRLHRDPAWLDSVLPTLRDFMDVFADAIGHPDNVAEYTGDKVADMDGNDAWEGLCAGYAAAKAAEAEWKAKADAIRDELIEFAKDIGCKNVKGCGYQVIRSERAGSVAYAKAIKDLAPTADLSAYTGKPATIYTVKECK